MLGGFISGLVVAWVLICFNVHSIIFEVIQPMTSTPLTTSHFYVALGLIGLIGSAFGK